ncbi:phosphoenolpyruvate carboxykinase (ATP) [Alkaliphilus sp. MSJ-5]|uniref:Phosphoenolpyruvate carboxykinase (ATP) n=1 Tax=Alkaliphilus flagellatus TaxID=2841507 RepID=A0ABS6G125_9FIRM|nr:phosphoenolpyruvate carboxykinase (ATP) [Alkaliphilus flagellatus]MBU5675343.1 phosphoenolpyruvate carboxykinase (ATP) [Alkaliphilus flagellatus]
MNNVNELIDSHILKSDKVHYNLPTQQLIDIAVEKEDGYIAKSGALCINTGKYTGRSPNDRFIVDEPLVHNHINWSKGNKSISSEKFENLFNKAMDYIDNKELFIFDGFVGADLEYRMPIRVINEFAYQNLFAQQMFIKPKEGERENFKPEFTVVALPNLKAVPEVDGTNSEVFIIISFEKKVVLIGGTKYSGEIKKSIFTVMNYLLPFKNVLPMHCSANIGEGGDVALFFGLSGTGKTTLSADKNRRLIGDDEHGWTENGVFNFEGGCYAKCINLTEEHEPQIWNAIKDGAILENVVIDETTGEPDYDDDKYTENTRAAYPVEHIDGAVMEGKGGIPKTIIFLTADATGVLPPISKLTKEQAMYHFMSGYTSKLAGTERGIVEPTATFSTCFGGPFMLLKPQVYAKLLGEKIEQYNTNVFLVNTGWTGGPYGVGNRMKLKYTRSMVRAAMKGELDNVDYIKDPIFNLSIPTECPDVPQTILEPSNTWEGEDAYYTKANELAESFIRNFEQFKDVSEDIKNANPKILG